jgi:hypothetical protein
MEMGIGQAGQNPAPSQVNLPSATSGQRPDFIVSSDGQNTSIKHSQGAGVRKIGILGGQLTVVKNEIRHGARSNSSVMIKMGWYKLIQNAPK